MQQSKIGSSTQATTPDSHFGPRPHKVTQTNVGESDPHLSCSYSQCHCKMEHERVCSKGAQTEQQSKNGSGTWAITPYSNLGPRFHWVTQTKVGESDPHLSCSFSESHCKMEQERVCSKRVKMCISLKLGQAPGQLNYISTLGQWHIG